MTRGCVSRFNSNRAAKSPLSLRGSFPCSWGKAGIAVLGAGLLIFWLGSAVLPAEVTNALPAQSAPGGEDFGQYLADHQADLEPFFTKNAESLVRLGVPLLMGLMGWVVCLTMLAGWIIDVLMGRGFALFFAPAFPDLKRAIIFATGRLFLSFVYTCLLGLAIVFSLKMAQAGIVMVIAVVLLLVVALAAQIVWILYLYRTNFFLSAAFYLAIIIVHTAVGVLIAKPVVGLRAAGMVAEFVDQAITPKLQAEADSTKRELNATESGRHEVEAKVADLQNQIAQARVEQEQLRKEIDGEKNSDIYIFGQIVQARARDELVSARDQLTAFLAQFPSSSLNDLARAQLAQINLQMVVEETQKKQQQADAAQAVAQARADLLARAGKGEATLSDIRQVLIGKTRAQVSGLLGPPSDTASDSWGYRRLMVLNPLTNEKYGLMVYFTEGIVQSVDYNRNGGSP